MTTDFIYCAYDLPNIRVDYNTTVRDLLRADGLSTVHARIYRPWIFRRHAPKGVLDNTRGVVSIAHHFSITIPSIFLKV